MPKTLVFLFSTAVLLISCNSGDSSTSEGGDADPTELQNRIDQLELDNAMKDSVINESLSFFNEIQKNLEAIGMRNDEIRQISSDAEIDEDDKKWILEEIKHINYLREDNLRLIKRLNGEIDKNNLKIGELEAMIEGLLRDIQSRDDQIAELEAELEAMDVEYSKLFSAFQEQEDIIDELTAHINNVYYAYGSESELISNGVIQKNQGFLGIGKKVELSESMNEKYFTKLDATKTDEVKILGSDIHMISTHPSESYTLDISENKTVIHIDDPSEFWKFNKYLVVVLK